MRSMRRSIFLSTRLTWRSITQSRTGGAASIKSTMATAINCFAGLGNQDRKNENHIIQDYERVVTIGPGFLYRAPPFGRSPNLGALRECDGVGQAAWEVQATH